MLIDFCLFGFLCGLQGEYMGFPWVCATVSDGVPLGSGSNKCSSIERTYASGTKSSVSSSKSP